MSHLKYHTYSGLGEYLTNNFGYSQSVLINGVIEISGQGGGYVRSSYRNLYPRNEDGSYPENLDEHIHNAWKNVEKTLKAAGGKGWDEVFSVTTYHCPMSEESLLTAVKYMKQYAPHKPLWTAVGVAALAQKEMQIEVVVKAKAQW